MANVKAILGVGAVLLVAAGGVVYATQIRPALQFAGIATAYAAKKVCSCRFVAERPMEACKMDFTEDVSMATFLEEPDAIRVELLGGRYADRAVFTPGQGCRLVPTP